MGKRIGIDVGGTNVKIALVDKSGKIIYSNSVPTYAKMGYEYTVNNIKQAIKDLMKETNTTTKDIDGIGFDFPGQVDYKTGVVKLAPNIPGWVNVPIAQMIEEEFHIPTRIDNDVRCAALGEMKFGAGQGCENFVCITVGTGIGSGLVVNGQLVRGASNAAGEIGHIKLQMKDGLICGCGDTGCLEAYASGPSIVAMAQDYIKGGKSTKFREMAAAEGGEITPYMVAKAAEAGDPVAKRIFAIVLLVVIGIGGFYFGYDIGRMDHDEERIRAELKKTTADSEISIRPVAKGGTGKTEIEILTECLEDAKDSLENLEKYNEQLQALDGKTPDTETVVLIQDLDDKNEKAYEVLKDLTENPAGYIAEKAAARGEGDEVWADDWAADIQVVKWLKENDGKRLYKENQAYILKILAFQEK